MEEPASKLVFLSILSFIAGVLVSPYFWGILFLPLLLLVVLFRDKKLLLLIFFFALGVVFYGLFSNPQDFRLPLYEGEEVTLTGRVVEEDRDVVEITDFKGDNLDERVLIHDQGDLFYGQIVKIKGEPVAPEEDFEKYLHRDKISTTFFEPQVFILESESSVRSRIFKIRRALGRKIERGSPFPQSEVLKALLLGDRSSLPDDLEDKFSAIGVAHLLAVSGTHIVIISGVILSLLTFFSIKWKYLLSVIILSAFILLVGAPVSAIRAGFLGTFLILAQKLGRRGNSLRGLVFIGFLMTLLDPTILRTVSFQLSFSASLGILLFSDRVKSFLTQKEDGYKYLRVKRFKNKIVEKIRFLPDFTIDTVAITLSAQIFTLPLVFYYFGHLPVLAPISNLVLAPLLPAIMILGIISLTASFIIPEFLAFIFADLAIKLVIIIVDLFYTFTLL